MTSLEGRSWDRHMHSVN